MLPMTRPSLVSSDMYCFPKKLPILGLLQYPPYEYFVSFALARAVHGLSRPRRLA